MIAQSSVQEVLNRADISEIVGQFVRLKKRGANFIANCPFHNEKTPSFYVSAAKGIYKCFGCGKGGNTVTFIQEHEKLTYPEAIRWLADYYKITLEESERTPEQQQQQLAEESLRILNEYAANHFTETLLNTEEGQAIGLSYFKQRGFRKEIIDRFRLGYNPEGNDSFYKAGIQKGYSAELLEKAGLVKNRNGSYHDVYRGRVIFPIQSMTGRVLGFGARILKSNDRAPKYINTPENELYNKSKILYGMYQSRQAIGKQDECFLVEGYTDVISLHQGGVENVVASSGTSLTEDQLRLIGQLTKNLTILYDGDAAGIKAALRGLDMALSQSFNVQLVLLPDGDDPDSYIQKSGAAKFYEYVKDNKRDVISFRLDVGMREAENDPVLKSKLVNEIAETISRMNKAEDFVIRNHYLKEAANKLNIDQEGLINLVNKFIRDKADQEKRVQRREEVVPDAPIIPEGDIEQELTKTKGTDDKQEWELIRVLVEHGVKPYEGYTNVAEYVHQTADPEMMDDPLAKKIYYEYFSYLEKNNSHPELRHFINHADEAVQQRMATLLSVKEEISPKWKENYGIETIHENLDYVYEVGSTLTYFELKKLKVVQAEVIERIKNESDTNRVMALLKMQVELKKSESEIMKKIGAVIFKQMRN